MQINISPWVDSMESEGFQLSRYLEPTRTKQKIIKVNVMLFHELHARNILCSVTMVTVSAVLCGTAWVGLV